MLGFGKDVRLDNPGGFDNIFCGEAARVLCDARTVRAKRATLRIAAGVAHLCDLGDTVAKLGAERATAGVAAGVAHLSDSLLARVNKTNSASVRALVADFFGDELRSFRD